MSAGERQGKKSPRHEKGEDIKRTLDVEDSGHVPADTRALGGPFMRTSFGSSR